MRKWFSIALVSAFGVLLSGPAMAGDEKGDKAKTEKGDKAADKKKPTGWDVVQYGEDLKVIAAEKLPELKKEIDKDHKEAQAKAKKEKKTAELKKFQILKNGLATKEEADKYVEKLKKEREKQKEKGDKGAEKAEKGAEKADKGAHKPAAK